MTEQQPPFDATEIQETLTGIATLYTENFDKHSSTSKSVGWKDEGSQLLRFQKLAQAINFETAKEGISVNDFGCGYGALFKYLDEIPDMPLVRYFGYDISEKMLGAARQFISDPRAELIQSKNITHMADYSFVSGTFNVKLETNDDIWAEYIKDMLVKLASKSTKGLAFNLLTTYVDWKQENLYYADPFLFFDFCKRNISRYVSLLHDYPLYEWTIVVRLDRNDSE